MTDRDSTQTTWERPSAGRDYTSEAYYILMGQLELNMHNALRDALGADRTLTPGGEGSIPLPAANTKEDI